MTRGAPCRSRLALLRFLLAIILIVLLRGLAVLVLAVFLAAIGEAGVAEAGPDREHAPALDVLHEGDFGKSLHHAVIMHQHRRVVLADLRNPFHQTCGQIELAALPIARQVLRTLFDRAVLVDDAGTGDADEWREL